MRRWASFAGAVAVLWLENGYTSVTAHAGILIRDDLGEVPLEDTGVVEVDVEVPVPSDAASLLLHCGGFGDEAVGTVAQIRDPSGAVWFDAEAPADAPSFRIDATDDGVTVLMPLTPEQPIVPGTWTVTVVVGPPKAQQMSCELVRATGGGAGRPTLSLDVRLLGFEDGEADDPRPPLRGLVRWLERSFARAGVDLQVTMRDDRSASESTYEVLDLADDDMSEFNALMRSATVDDPRAIPVFVVQRIVNHSKGSAQILGIASGPPGAFAGTSKSGIVVNATDLQFDPAEVGRIVEHEIGHFLGLFHTTEKKGQAADLLVDTPVCVNDADANGVLSSKECGEQGFRNVMWWTMGHPRAGWTEQQRWLLQHHPLVAP